jgi:protein-S-isoprenylcysteine O-methyltransferase Ste14
VGYQGTVSPKRWAALGSAVFFVLAPGFVGGYVPWLLTRWHARPGWTLHAYWLPLRILGAALVLAGVAVLLHAFGRFVTEGLGTPAPVAAPRHLVIGGLYRYVRNPMYLAVLATIAGQALVLGQVSLLWYGLVVAAAFVAFVLWYEEPALTARFGEEYREYRRHVRGWWPRARPWQGQV